METYQLKDKIQITKEYIETVAEKGWQEIKNLQNQVSNIKIDSTDANKFIQLLNNLITSYYVFVGGLETLTSEPVTHVIDNHVETHNNNVDSAIDEPVTLEATAQNERLFNTGANDELDDGLFEPFEYLVDFDEPTGDRISDEDLYGKN